EFLCEHRAPLVLSCKHFSGLERSRFMVDFAMTLFRKWTGGVLHLVLEEAHELAPQMPPKGEKAEEMLGAFKRLWKLGRSSGIGGTAVTQRPASLHKDITTQSEILVVHRTIGPQDVEAVRQWIKYHHEGEDILPELATLKTGEAFVWAPEFPEDKPVGLRRVQVLPRETFDSASTPKPGEQRTEPRELAPVDLERLRSKMSATIERAKADDPKELRKTIAELRKQIATKPAAAPAPKPEVRTVDVPILKDSQLARLEASLKRCEKISERATLASEQHHQIAQNARAAAYDIRQAIEAAKAPVVMTRAPVAPVSRPAPAPVAARAAVSREAAGSARPGGGVGRMLQALAFAGGRLARRELGVLAVVHQGGGSFDTYVSKLTAGGTAERTPDGYQLTDAGWTEARELPALNLDDVLAAWAAKLPGGAKRMFEVLRGEWPSIVTRDDLGARAGVSPAGGSYDTYLSKMVSPGVAERVAGGVKLNDVLFSQQEARA
ncbi:MAG: hypothetical protein QOG85_1494, partial [Gaiellaceae bacterium]|nr:hypothetical protein [Gaiellaceae bacterium]